MKQGVTKCEWCLTENNNENTQCVKCGGPVAALEPWVLQCGWCKSSNRRDLVSHCKSCGGELPHIPGTLRQPAPPLAPRQINLNYRNWVRYKGNTLMLIGIAFTAMGTIAFFSFLLVGLTQTTVGIYIALFVSIFPIIGIASIIKSNKYANQKLNALQYGIATKGFIDYVKIDTNQAINKIHPVTIHYNFSDGTDSYNDTITVWDHANLKRPNGEHIWVVFNPKDLKQNNVWPPLR